MTANDEFGRLVGIMQRLRQECPWDRSQTHDSLRPYLLEEAYEVIHALDAQDHESLREELGDLILQVVFHAELAQEAGRFDIEQVIRGINEKLIRRHPHVFADTDAKTPAEVVRRWENIKAGEGNKASSLDGVPAQLPALVKAARVLTKVRQWGLDPYGSADPAAEVTRWLGRLQEAGASDTDTAGQAVGMLALAVVEAAGRAGVGAEDALRATVGRLIEAFQRVEAALACEGRRFADLSGGELADMAARILSECEGGPD